MALHGPLTLNGVFAQCACSFSSAPSPHPRRSCGLFSPRSARVLMLVSIYNLCDIVNCAPSHQTKAQESNFKIISPCSVCAELDQPMRYNSKMMNSIWGRYNEDSVHNFKSLQCAGKVAAEFQQTQALQMQQQQQQLQLQQQPQQQLQQAAPEPGLGLRQRLGELGQAVTANFMDNLHQY
ncbi:uncharacterized protein LOC125047853 isoform X3 [Penaeus chinensis]|uniref:uncharacterized protein LOC125047853 isoform X3 n=1 Tax=Penaeus chinensis TaxID=139456 RepID=UPI001FB7E14E|nr:uncharacterized protein LOC125047853 isoform X3 [Penaeus chinensis]